jgi:hypothetical protein
VTIEPAQGSDASGRLTFSAASISAPAFWDDPAVDPGPAPKTPVDSVVFAGTGELNGIAGYRFQARASDRGEPGIGHDTFALTVYAPDNSVVAAIGGTIVQGNIQSLPIGQQ